MLIWMLMIRIANLDVDDTDSYGPETVTISKKHFGESYIYGKLHLCRAGL